MLKIILLSAGRFLKMSLLSCDGGHKDNFSKPENVLTDNWSSEGRIILLLIIFLLLLCLVFILLLLCCKSWQQIFEEIFLIFSFTNSIQFKFIKNKQSDAKLIIIV